MTARADCAHPSIRDHWELRCTSRRPNQVASLKRDPPSNLDTHLSTHCMARQPMRAKVYCAQHSILGSEGHVQWGDQSDAKTPVLCSQESLVLIYRPTEVMKGLINLAQPGV
ncbi:hypothetical protein TNCV_4645621 [Trichonephila clavipes]|nr:hypothetical protein TNCV_4645621 [Trichonephila clavipes]